MDHLTALDISPTAIRRAQARCAGLDNTRFEIGSLTDVSLPQTLDLIVCSEVLYYLDREHLLQVAGCLADSVRNGGSILLAHGNSVSDDRDHPGFDWGHDFGAKTIGQVFSGLASLDLVREIRTPLFTVHLLRRRHPDDRDMADFASEIVTLPPDLILSPHLERTILWDGVTCTRAEAEARELTSTVPILMYHSIADDGPPELAPYRVSRENFIEQLRYLRRNGYYSLDLQQWCDCIVRHSPVRGRPVIITFDDAYQDFLDSAWPALERSGFTATLFVVTGRVGGAADWDQHSAAPLKLLGWQDLRALADKGVKVGSHSVNHPDFLTLPADQVFAEGEQAKAALLRELGLEVTAIAFPWGRSDAGICDALARCGCRIGLTTRPGFSQLSDNLMHLPRVEITGQMDIEDFARALNPPPSTAPPAERPPLVAEASADNIAELPMESSCLT